MWYKKYNWNKNPFLIKFSTELVDREKEKTRILDYVNSGDICIVTGDSGVGKTSLLKWLQKQLRRYKVHYINAEGLNEFFSIQRKIGKFIIRKPVVLVDEAQYCDENFMKELKLLYDDNTIKSVVIAQTEKSIHDYVDSFKSRVGKRTIKLTGITPKKALELISIRTKDQHPFDEKTIKIVVDDARKNPRKILENCELLCIELQHKEFTPKNIKQVLDYKNKEDLFNIVKLEKPTIPNNLMPISNKKLNCFSPMQKKLILILLEGNRTAKQLSIILNSSEGSVGKQISKLNEKKIVKTMNHRRPKIYGLTDDFKNELN